MVSESLHGLELRTVITPDWHLELSLDEVDIPEPGPDQIVVRMEAAPVNPSDGGRLLTGVDLSTLRVSNSGGRRLVTAKIHQDRMGPLPAPLGVSAPAGNEGAGTVVKAGSNAQSLLGRVVSLSGGGMYTQYRLANVANCMVLPQGSTARQGAAAYVNPMTALCIVETMHRDGYGALIHTAAASALGQMLVRICAADAIPLVNVVRSPDQAKLLTDMGAEHVVDSSSPDFAAKLVDAIAMTGARVAFDEVGGGPLATQLLGAMESAITRASETYSRYGSSVHKQLYVYGGLNLGPITIDRREIGMYWGVDSFMTSAVRTAIGPEGRKRMEQRILDELETTFATEFKAELTLVELLDPERLKEIYKRSTGGKYLINPARGLN